MGDTLTEHPPAGTPFRAVIEPGPQRVSGSVHAQPSKNYTTRLLLAAALADGVSIVRNVASSEDAAALRRCLECLGAGVAVTEADGGRLDARVTGFGAKPRLAPGVEVNPGNAGAVLRFLLAVGALLPEVRFVTDRPDSLGKRPNSDILTALAQMGCASESDGGFLPVTLRGGALRGGQVRISGAKSSQFLSGLLFLAPLVGEPVEFIVTDRLVSKDPVRQTLEVLQAAGVRVTVTDDMLRYRVEPGAYAARTCEVNGDWPGSAALLAAGTIAGGPVAIRGLLDDNQGERAAAHVLAQMGADVRRDAGAAPGLTVAARRPLRAVQFDGDKATDAVLALVGAACFAEGRSRFHNVSNLRIKECDRISEPLAELRKVGVRCFEGAEVGDRDPDAILVDGSPDGYEGGVVVDGRRDHRVIMLLATVGLGCRRGLAISGAEHVAKSYPGFFRDLCALGARVRFEAE
jgi:3-phosphoshikimate 1-carboxyvinyltransferase